MYPCAVLYSIQDNNGAKAVGINSFETMNSTTFDPSTVVRTVCGEGGENLEAYTKTLTSVNVIQVFGEAIMYHLVGPNKTTPKELGIPTLIVPYALFCL